MPERIQLKRTKGWRMPENTVKVDRTTKWGNPMSLTAAYCWHPCQPDRNPSASETREFAVAFFTRWISGMDRGPYRWTDKQPPEDIAELRGKNLACWCKPGEPCHADVLLELANQEPPCPATK